MALKWALGILAAGNIVFFNLWMNEKEKRIAQEVHFSTVESERKIKDDKSVITQKKSLCAGKNAQSRSRKIAIVLIMLFLLMWLNGCAAKHVKTKNNCIYSVVTYGQALDCLKELHEAQ